MQPREKTHSLRRAKACVLPQNQDGAELDRWLEQAAADYANNEFIFLVIAAIAAGREIHARHLAKGAAILDSAGVLHEIAMKMTGDVPEYLMQASRTAS